MKQGKRAAAPLPRTPIPREAQRSRKENTSQNAPQSIPLFRLILGLENALVTRIVPLQQDSFVPGPASDAFPVQVFEQRDGVLA